MIELWGTDQKQEKNLDTIINLHTLKRLLAGSEAIDHAMVGIEATAINNGKDSHTASM